MKNNDTFDLMQRLQGNLSTEEKKAFFDVLVTANVTYSARGEFMTGTPESRAKAVFKREKTKVTGKLKKLYAAMQKSNDIKDALDVHYKLRAEKNA